MASRTVVHRWATKDKSFRFLVEKVTGGLEVKLVDVAGQSDSIVATSVDELDEFVGILQAVRPYLVAVEPAAKGARSREAAEETERESEESEEDDDADEEDDDDLDEDDADDFDDEDEDDED